MLYILNVLPKYVLKYVSPMFRFLSFLHFCLALFCHGTQGRVLKNTGDLLSRSQPALVLQSCCFMFFQLYSGTVP